MTTLSRDLFLVLYFCNKVENRSETVCPKEREEENLLLKKKKEQTPGMLHAVFFLFYFLLSFFAFESEYNAYLRLLVMHK